MNKKLWFRLWAIFIVVAVIIIAVLLYLRFQNTSSSEKDSRSSIKLVAWNLHIFGDAKSKNVTLMHNYVTVITNHDVAIIQEIRDADNSSFWELCTLVNQYANYSCLLSSRAGSTSSKEQYGVFIRITSFENQSIIVQEIIDYNENDSLRVLFERPPLAFTVGVENYSVTIVTIHTKPDAVPEELSALESLDFASNSRNTLIIGDLNADCSYYSRSKEGHFSHWKWIISDTADTTSGSSNCAYDRIIANKNATNEIKQAIIYSNFSSDISDHYPIAVVIATND